MPSNAGKMCLTKLTNTGAPPHLSLEPAQYKKSQTPSSGGGICLLVN